jgi:hypothetical protein
METSAWFQIEETQYEKITKRDFRMMFTFIIMYYFDGHFIEIIVLVECMAFVTK